MANKNYIFVLALFISMHIPLNLYAGERKIIFLGLLDYKKNKNQSFQVWSISEYGESLNKLTDVKSEVIGLNKVNENKVAYITSDLGLHVMDLSSRKVESLLFYKTEKKYQGRTILSLSPDMARVVVSSRNENGYYLSFMERNNSKDWNVIVNDMPFCNSPIQWSCSSPYSVYFIESSEGVIKSKIKSFNINSEKVDEIYSSKKSLYSYSISGDKRTIAISYNNEKTKRSEIAIFIDEKLFDIIKSNFSIMDPYLSCDGMTLLYVDDIELDKQKLVLYSINSKKKRVVLRDKGAISLPILYEQKENTCH